MKKLMIVLAVLAVFGLATAQAALIVGGQSIGVDLHDTSGTTANWSNFTTAGTDTTLQDRISGNAIDGSVSWSYNAGSNGGDSANSGLTNTAIPLTAVRDHRYVWGTPGPYLIVAFSGLDASLTYTAEVYSFHPSDHHPEGAYVIGAVTSATLTWYDNDAYAAYNSSGTPSATFSGVSPTAGGALTVRLTKAGAGDDVLRLSAVVLTAEAPPIAEPAGLGLLGIAVLALRRRRA